MNMFNITIICTMLICLLIVIIAIIRLRLCQGSRRARLKYTLILVCAIMGICQPVSIYIWPGSTELLLSLVLLTVLLTGVPPLKAYKDSNDFFDTEIYDPHIHGGE